MDGKFLKKGAGMKKRTAIIMFMGCMLMASPFIAAAQSGDSAKEKPRQKVFEQLDAHDQKAKLKTMRQEWRKP